MLRLAPRLLCRLLPAAGLIKKSQGKDVWQEAVASWARAFEQGRTWWEHVESCRRLVSGASPSSSSGN